MTLYSRQDAKEAGQGFGAGAVIITACTLFFLLLGALVWYWNVSTSGIKGKGDVKRQNNSASNQIAAQAAFNSLWGDIQGYRNDITASAALVAQDPDNAFQQSVLTAQRQTCQSAVGKYNGYANDTTMREWRPSGDPASIDANTECEAAR